MTEINLTPDEVLYLPNDLLIYGLINMKEVYIDGQFLNPKYSQRTYNHSPDGFNWGYGGSGPAQLALAILLKYLPQEAALAWYQDFKFSIVASWPQTDFEVRVDLIAFVQQQQSKP